MSPKTHKYNVINRRIGIIIAITWCTFLVYNAQSLKCYQCIGYFNESTPAHYMDCIYLNNSPNVVTCIGVTQCFETFGDTDANHADDSLEDNYIIRGCVVTNTTTDKNACRRFEEGGFEGYVCRCDTELCNNHTETHTGMANCKLEASSSSVVFGFVFLQVKMIACI